MTISPNPVPKSRTPPAKPAVATPERARWIMFMPTIPAKPAAVRVRSWRRLQASGAGNLRGAVYVLPNREDCIELFEWLSRELVGLGGQASLCEGRFIDATPADEIQTPYSDARLEGMPRPTGATWVTRTGVHVERIACSWVIRRFIDPKARLKFVQPKGYVPAPGELRFDMFDAEFTPVGDRCSFVVLFVRMELRDRALVAIAEIIHDLDLLDGMFDLAPHAGGFLA